MTTDPTATYSKVWSENQSKVFVWGLNDKDQLGGLKGSKVKVPVYSETLTSLKPIHIAGGSKSLFIVSCDGKVRKDFSLIFFLSHLLYLF